MRAADRTTLGDLLLRDHRDEVGIPYRSVLWGGEVAERDQLGNYTARGHADSGDEEPSLGDLQGALSVPAESQAQEHREGLGSWWFACAAASTRASRGAQDARTGTGQTRERGAPESEEPRLVSYRPVRDQAWTTDDRYAEVEAGVPADLPGFPAGTPGVVLTGSEERSQQHVFLPAMGNQLVAPHRAGDPSLATLVYDLRPDDRVDPVHAARLSSAWRVVNVGPPGCGSYPAAGALAWLMAPGGRDGYAGGGLVVDGGGPEVLGVPTEPEREQTLDQPDAIGVDDPNRTRTRAEQDALDAEAAGTTRERGGGEEGDGTRTRDGDDTTTRAANLVFAMLSTRHGGPIDVGSPGDQHRIRGTEDGPLNAAHLSTRALFRGGVGDGPLLFEPVGTLDEVPAPFTTAVHLRWDGTLPHNWGCGSGTGLWRWQGETFMTVPEEEEGSEIFIPSPEPEPFEDSKPKRPVTGGGTETGPGETDPECNPYPGEGGDPLATGWGGERPSVTAGPAAGESRERGEQSVTQTRQQQKSRAGRWAALEAQLGVPTGSIRGGRVEGLSAERMQELVSDGVLNPDGTPASSLAPTVGQTGEPVRTVLGGVESRIPTVPTAMRVGGPLLLSSFATADGELDMTRGAVSVTAEDKAKAALGAVTVGGFAAMALNSTGRWDGATAAAGQEGKGGGKTGLGAMLLVPSALATAAGVGEVIAGDHDPSSGSKAGTVDPISLLVPGSVAQIDFAMPGGTEGVLARSGVRLKQGILGLGMRVLDGSGSEVSSPKFDFGEGGGIFTGNLEVTGKLTVGGLVDPPGYEYDKQSSNPHSGSAYGVFVSNGTLAGTSDGDLCYSKAGTVEVLSGGVGASDRLITAGRATISSTSTETAILSGTVPGGTLGTSEGVRFAIRGRIVNLSGSAQTVTLRIKYGSTTLYADVSPSLANFSTQLVTLEGVLYAQGSTGQQLMAGTVSMSDSVGASTGNGDWSGPNAAGYTDLGGASSEASTGDLTLQVTLQFTGYSSGTMTWDGHGEIMSLA